MYGLLDLNIFHRQAQTRSANIIPASFLWGIGKQHCPRYYTESVQSGTILFASPNIRIKIQTTPDAINNDSGLAQMITMGKSICQRQVIFSFYRLQ